MKKGEYEKYQKILSAIENDTNPPKLISLKDYIGRQARD